MDKAYGQALLDERARAWEQAKDILGRCAEEKRERTAEEEEMYQRASADMDRLGKLADEWAQMARIEAENDAVRSTFEGIVRPEVQEQQSRKEASQLVNWLSAHTRAGQGINPDGVPMAFEFDLKPAANFLRMVRAGMDANEARAIYTDGGASAGSIVVPVGFETQLYQYIEADSAIRRISRIITTDSGNPMTFPKVATHAVGTRVIAQGTAIGGTDPVFGTMRLDAYKYGELVKVATEAAADTGFDLIGFVAENIGRAVGRITDTAYVTGSGSSAPNGIVTAASNGATTGGSLIALGGGAATAFTQTLDCLITLQHSVVAAYRNKGVFVMHDSTAGTVRKVRDGGAGTIGSYIWTPSTTFDSVSGLRTPDTLFGSPVYTDVNFGTNGSSVKQAAFGDFSAYYIRDSGNFRLERSDERYFDTDEIGFRGVLRTDSDLIDTGAIKLLEQNV